MTDRATLEALLARVLEGEGPDRELDAEIDLYLLDAGIRAERFSIPFDAPHYTASLDAALTVFFGNPPPLIPSEPRLVLRDALRERMEAQGE